MGWTARFFRQQRKDQKIAEEVAKRIEEANRPLEIPRPRSPVEGTLRYNANRAVMEVYARGQWIIVATPDVNESASSAVIKWRSSSDANWFTAYLDFFFLKISLFTIFATLLNCFGVKVLLDFSANPLTVS